MTVPLVSSLQALDQTPEELQAQKAQRLAETGVRFELDGATDYARFAWESALRANPDCELARWRLGYVRTNGEWASTNQSPSVELQTKLIEYSRRRDLNSDRHLNELALATWCQANGIRDRSKIHFRRIVDNPKASEHARRTAIQALGLRSFGDRFLSVEEITALQAKMRQARQNLASWSKRLAAPFRQLESGRLQKRMLGLENLRQIDDPTAIPALELNLSSRNEALANELVQIIGRINAPEASESLARHAVASQWPSVRQEATKLLQTRSLHDYIPTLMTGLRMPIRSVFQITSGNDGQILHEHLFVQEGAEEHHQLLVSNLAVATTTDENVDNRDELRRLKRQALQVDRNVTMMNLQHNGQNARIYQLLRSTTGEELDSTPTAWWDWWKEYNEYELVANKPVRRERRRRQFAYQPISRQPRRSSSECFPRGTLIWTELGKRPIETVKVGDRVLSQRTETGELAYKVVKAVTRREQAPMQTVSLGSQQLTLTTGHPLWINNTGWRMAKLLKRGDQVHCLNGSRKIDQSSPAPPETAFNLIIDDFGSYFVTELGILAHDNTYRRPNRVISPGLVAKK